MSQERRQDFAYPPGPRPRRDRKDKRNGEELAAPSRVSQLRLQFSVLGGDQQAIVAALGRVPWYERFNARIALYQALGGPHFGGGAQALALCEQVFGKGTVDFPSERISAEQTRAPRAAAAVVPAPPKSTSGLGPREALRAQALRELLVQRVRAGNRPDEQEQDLLLGGLELGVVSRALRDMNEHVVPGDPTSATCSAVLWEHERSFHLRAQFPYYLRAERPGPESVKVKTGRGHEVPRFVTAPIGLPRLAGQHVLGSWETNEAETRRAPDLDDPALRALGQGGGEPLPEALLQRMNWLFAHDFVPVRVHTDAQAARAAKALGARALAIGRHIYFGEGRFAPGTPAGDRLLVHELMHVVQFDQGRLPARVTGQSTLSQPQDSAEREADAAEARIEAARGAAHRAESATPRHGADLPASCEPAGWSIRAGRWLAGTALPEVRKHIRTLDQRSGGRLSQGSAALAQAAAARWPRATKTVVAVAARALAALPLPADGTAEPDETHAVTVEALVRQSTGALLPEPIARQQSAALRHDVRGVYIHTDEAAARAAKQLGAQAFTMGRHIYFAAGQYAPDTPNGRRLLVHELTHVVQYDQGRLRPTSDRLETTRPDEPVEREARAAEEKTPPEGHGDARPEVADRSASARGGGPNAGSEGYRIAGRGLIGRALGAVSHELGQIYDQGVIPYFSGKIKAFVATVSRALGPEAITARLKQWVQRLKGWVTGLLAAARKAIGWLSSDAAAWVKQLEQRTGSLFDVLGQVAMAVINPAAAPILLAGALWRSLPAPVKGALIDFLLHGAIWALRKMKQVPFFGLLWNLVRAPVLGFLETLYRKPGAVKVKVIDKLVKIASGASGAFLFGFVKGMLQGVWDGVKEPVELAMLVAKGMGMVADLVRNLVTQLDGQQAAPVAPAPAAQAVDTDPQGGAAAAAAMSKATAAAASIQADNIGAVVTRLAGELAAEQAPDATPASDSHAQPGATPSPHGSGQGGAGEALSRLWTTLKTEAKTVGQELWPAVREAFQGGGGGGKGMSLSQFIAKMRGLWNAIEQALKGMGAALAEKLCAFFDRDQAEGELGRTVGYWAGNIGFGLLLDYLSAGTWRGAGAVLRLLAQFLNWPSKVFDKVLGLLGKLGKLVLVGAGKLGGLAKKSAGSALSRVSGAFGRIGQRLSEVVEQLGSRMRGKGAGAASKGAHTAEREAAEKVEAQAVKKTEQEAAQNATGKVEKHAASAEARKAAELPQAIGVARVIIRAAKRIRIPAAAVTTALRPLQLRYKWIKQFRTRPAGPVADILLIASEYLLDQLPNELKEALESAPVKKKTDPLETGEVIPYKESKGHARGEVGDQLTGDHIPSFAALLKAEEDRLGRELSSLERARLKDDALVIIDTAADHAKHSRTFKGRNTEKQILEDAGDLVTASHLDIETKLSGYKRDGKLTKEIVAAYINLYYQLCRRGTMEPSPKTNAMLVRFLREVP